MSKPKAPPPPDPNQVAQAQTQQNQDTALYNAMLNRVNTYTPLGSQEYSITGTDPTTGAPMYRQDINLSPQAQALYNQQLGQNLQLGNIAGDMMSQVQSSYGSPIDTSGLNNPNMPNLQGSVNIPGSYSTGYQAYDPQMSLNRSGLPELQTDVEEMRQNAQDALYNRNTEYLDDRFGRGEESLRTRLANQGIVEGSEAYSNAVDDFNRGRETAYRQARNEAIAGAGTEAERLFGLSSAARGQLFGEELAGGSFANQASAQATQQNAQQAGFGNDARSRALAEALAGGQFTNQARQQGMDERAQRMQELFALRNQPLNEFNALRSASPVDMPQFSSMPTVGTNPADIAGAMYNQYQGNLDAYNAQQQSRNSLLNGLFGLGGAAIMASDERVKEDIHEVGELNDGTNVYLFRYKGDSTPQVGVMAQEIEKRDPSAVVEKSGVKHVDYAKVLAKALEAA